MDKRNFFKEINDLPLEEKIGKIKEGFDDIQALQIITNLIARDKTLSMEEKRSLIKKHLSKQDWENSWLEVVKKSQSKQRNLSNRIKLDSWLKEYLKLELSRGGKKEKNNIKVLNALTTFLTLKRDENEFVSKQDCQIISQFFIPDLYPKYRDQMNSLIIVCFRFRKQLIKQLAAIFVAELLERKIVDTVLTLELVRGGYVSTEVSSLLLRFSETIKENEYLQQEIISEMKRLYALPSTTSEEKLTLEKIINTYV